MSSSNSSLMKDNNSTNNGGSENSSSNGEVGGNNSDNSALVSLGNTSFGFNFDSEEGNMNNTSNSEEGDSSSDQDGRKQKAGKPAKPGNGKSAGSSNNKAQPQKKLTSGAIMRQQQQLQRQSESEKGAKNSSAPPTAGSKSAMMSAGDAAANKITSTDGASSSTSRSTNTLSPSTASSSTTQQQQKRSHSDAALQAVASLHSIAKSAEASRKNEKHGLKRKSPDSSSGTQDNDSNGGYNSDDEGKATSAGASSSRSSSQATHAGAAAAAAAAKQQREQAEEDGDEIMKQEAQDDDGPDNAVSGGKSQKSGGSNKNKKKKLDDMKREERNAREKERSFRISKQINELRDLLSSGGVIVPKGTKSSVLTEAANYIRMLQQHQYRSEVDRHQLVQQIQMIGGGALGQQAASAVRHVAAQNGVWSLGNFGGVPPKSAMMYHQSGATEGGDTQAVQQEEASVLPNTITEGDYRHIFNSCTVGMAIASMGGAFIDCNKLFCQLANYSKQEVCSMTVFNLTSRQDLQPAFDLISQMLSAPADPSTTTSTSCVLRGAFKHRSDLGLDVSLIKGEDGVAKCFCVTLILNPTSPFDTSRPVPATIELVGLTPVMNNDTVKQSSQQMDQAPAYTAG